VSKWARASAAALKVGKGVIVKEQGVSHRVRVETARGVPPGTQGFVYLIRNTATGSIKIGFTQQAIEDRLRKLQQGSDARLELIGSLRAQGSEERRLHSACARHRLDGEWFSPEGEVLRVVSLFAVEERCRGYMLE
jgi:hypothetical protein